MNTQKSIMNTRYAEKRTRSANAPVMSDGVMIANFIWKSAKSASGMVGAIASFTFAPTSRNMKNCDGLPMSPPALQVL